MKIINNFTAWSCIVPKRDGKALVIIQDKDVRKNEISAYLSGIGIDSSAIISFDFSNKTEIKYNEIGFCLIICDRNGSVFQNSMKDIFEILNISIPICIFSYERKVIKSLQKNIGIVKNFYGVFPNFEKARWIIPLDKRFFITSAKGIFAPSKNIKRYIWMLVKLLANIRLHWIIFSGYIAVIQNEMVRKTKLREDLRSSICRRLGVNFIEFAILNRKYRYDGKITLQIMNKNAKTIAYIKLADNEKAKALIANEVKIFSKLRNMKINNCDIPEIYYYYNNKAAELAIVAEDTTNSPNFRLEFKHVNLLVELYKKSNSYISFNQSAVYALIKQIKNYRNDALYTGIYPVLEKSANKVLMNSKDKFINVCLAHCDFAPWNTCNRNNGKLVVFDWELANANEMAYYDIFDYIVNTEGLERQRCGKKVISIIFNKRKRYYKLLESYKNAISEKNHSSYIYYLAIYLIKKIHYYIERKREQQCSNCSIDIKAEEMLAILCEMLSCIAEAI